MPGGHSDPSLPSGASENVPSSNPIEEKPEPSLPSGASENVPSSNPIEEKPEPSTAQNLVEGADALARAISSTLGSVITGFDQRAEGTAKSQEQLSAAIDRLTRELDQLLDDAPLPFIMQHAAKIAVLRKRVSSLNVFLRTIQRRIDNIDRMLSAGITQEKQTAENTRLNQH